jgi:hypothetical protein
MTLMQLHSADRLRGRVFAALGVCGALFAIFGAAIAGLLGQTVDVIVLLSAHAIGAGMSGLIFGLIAGPGPTRLVEPAVAPPQPRAALSEDLAPLT